MYPAVTASPYQPPLGKGAKEIRIATTSDIDHWFRNDREFCMGACWFLVARKGGALLPTVVPTD